MTPGNYTQIPNDELVKLNQINLSSAERRIIGVIQRYTYGWQKYRARISESVFARETKMDTRNVSRTVKKLLEKQIITVQIDGKKHFYNINRDLTAWIPSEQTAKPNTVQTDGENTVQTDGETPSKQTDNKENNKEPFKESVLEKYKTAPQNQKIELIEKFCQTIPLFKQFNETEKKHFLTGVEKKIPACNGSGIIFSKIPDYLNQYAEQLLKQYETR